MHHVAYCSDLNKTLQYCTPTQRRMNSRSSIPQRRKYDSFVAYLYSQNKEMLLPQEFRNTIPASTASDWRYTDYESYYGAEFRRIQQQSLEYYELFAQYKNLKRTVTIIAKVWKPIADLVTPVLAQSKPNNEKLLDAIQILMTVMPKRTVLKIFKVSVSAYQYRLDKLRRKCGLSPFQLCMRRHPGQLCVKEIEKMRTILKDERFVFWPLSSIAWWAKRQNEVMAALSTWYKYAPMLGWKRKKFETKVKEGVKSTHPNEYLHADTTYYKLEDGRKAAAVLVSDNFSKAILGSTTAKSNGAVNVVAALRDAALVMKQYHPALATASLIVDGGGENNAHEVTQCLSDITPPEISKFIALKDVNFSNSPVEAINKILKRYLRHFKPKTFEQFTVVVNNAIQDYNYNRPHGSLNGLPPMEAYTSNAPNMDFERNINTAKAERTILNKKMNCDNVC